GHRAARRRQHRTGEAGLLRAVLAWIAVGADLAWVFHRRAGRARGQPVDLDHARVVAAADRGGRGQAAHVEVAQPARAADAELAVTLGVAIAQGDRVEVVPDPQQVRRVAGADEGGHARVGVLGGDGDAVQPRLVDLDRAEQQL